jgi:large subunit ribosomal protein L2
MTVIDRKKPEKSLLISLNKSGGRNSQGRITIRHRGGGLRKMWRKVDFGQEHLGVIGKIVGIEYDPNRTAYLAFIQYQDGAKGYLLAAQGMESGKEVLCAEKTEVQPGNRMKLEFVPIGTQVHSIELEPGRGGKMARGAGSAATVLAHEGGYVHLSMPSSEIRKVSEKNFASIGAVSNPEHRYKIVGKAGTSRRKGRRPHVRGTAMNPKDHPHGGGEGRQPIGLKHPKTPWGKPALGVKTRNKKKWTIKLIMQRRQKKKKK